MAVVPFFLIYGSNPPDIRYKETPRGQVVFCRHNDTLHLRDEQLCEGTFTAGQFLSAACRKHCRPKRARGEPCGAFSHDYLVGREDGDLARVNVPNCVLWEDCGGVAHVLNHTDTVEEREFLLAYLDAKAKDEGDWRRAFRERWNESWHRVGRDWVGRRDRWESAMWLTFRFPALIPQAWLNWMAHVDDPVLDRLPSRVDFMAFHRGVRHVIEIDGPSHYANWDGQSAKVDEREYARNLRLGRGLAKAGWQLTRIARVEVADAMKADLLRTGHTYIRDALPFGTRHATKYVPELTFGELDLEELEDRDIPVEIGDAEIPF
jgi:hypothetical protein